MADNERDERWIDFYDDEALKLMQGWTGGENDPLYAISSSGGNYAWVFSDAIENLDADIESVKKIGRNKYQLGKGTFTKQEIDELRTIRDALAMALESGGMEETRESRGGMRLIYLPANSAWAFVFGDSPTRMAGDEMFFRNRRDAVASAKRHGLAVDRKGNVTPIGGDYDDVGRHSWKPGEAREGRRSEPVDEHAVTDLVLYIDNTSDLSPDGPSGQGKTTLLNALRKWRKGTYDPERAVQLFEYLTEAGARRYAKEFSIGTDWNTIFSKATRREAARQLEASFRNRAENGEYDDVDIRRGASEARDPYPYPTSHTGQYRLTRDGKEVLRGSEGEIWKWMHRHESSSIEHALRYEGYKIEPISQHGTREGRSSRVADFNTLHDLIAHAANELGATHVAGHDANTRIYFPRGGQWPYEEAQVRRKAGYWHADGPHARTGVASLPSDAKPIGRSRRAAEPRQISTRDARRPRRRRAR